MQFPFPHYLTGLIRQTPTATDTIKKGQIPPLMPNLQLKKNFACACFNHTINLNCDLIVIRQVVD